MSNVEKISFVGFLLLALFTRQVPATQEDFYDETVLRILELEFSQSDWWNQLEANYQTKENIIATLTADGVAYEGVGVRFRGNTSYMMIGNSQKKSFNIEIDYTIEDQRLMDYKTLNLINCANDPTFMREVLYSNTCRRQIPSAKANFVKLVINGQNWGIYANVQQLNAEFIEDWFPSNDGTRWRAEGRMGGTPGGGGGGGQIPNPRTTNPTGADATLTEAGGGGGFGDGSAALTWQGSDSTIYEQVYELKSTEQDDPWASLIDTCDVLNNTPLDQLPNVLDTVLNVDRALWLCAFEIIFQDEDGYVNKRGSDYCIYYEPETGRLHLIQYDGNECMNSSGRTGWSLFYQADDPVVPLMYRLMTIDRYRQRYLAHVRTILNSFFTEDDLLPRIDAYQTLIESEVESDSKKLYTTQAFISGISTLKNFINTHRSNLLVDSEVNRSVPYIVSVEYEVIQEQAGQSLVITALLGESVPVENVQLFLAESLYCPFTSLQMALDDEAAIESVGSSRYVVTLSPYEPGTVLRFYVQATAADGVGTMAFSPAGAENDVYTYVVTYAGAETSPVVFNELMARNVSTIADPQGDYDDWIELYNTGGEIVDLSGMYLSDNPENPLKWQFPAGTTIASGGYLLVWADEDGGDEPGLHANFKLSSSGETLWLYDNDSHNNVLLDSVTFTDMEADQSMGCVPDGFGEMRILSVPSPLGSNTASLIDQAQEDAQL
jgi:hypothetical protein